MEQPRTVEPAPAAELEHTAIAGLAQRLVSWFAAGDSYVVALSGGVDSGVVAKAASLSAADVRCVTARSPSVAARELADAERVIAELGLAHEWLDTQEVADPRYQQNDAQRCFYCKSQLFAAIRGRFPQATIVTGTNADDLHDYRPGLAAAAQAEVQAPLAMLGIDKLRVRALADYWQLHLADKPASPCLASRIAHGVAVTPQRLAMVEQAEALIRQLGIREFRVRLHADELARIELPPPSLAQFVVPEVRQRIGQGLRELGFRFVTLDLDGFRSGSLNPLVQLQTGQTSAAAPSSVKPPAS